MIGLALWLLCAQGAPTEKECVEFAKKIEQSIATEDGSWVDQNFDGEALAARVMKDTPSLEPMRAGIFKSLADELPLAKVLSKNTNDAKGQFVFLGLRVRQGKSRALFRQVAGGLNYHEFVLEKGPTGSVRIVDDFAYTEGELYSETLRRVFLAALAANPAAGGKQTPQENEYLQHLPKMKGMVLARNSGKPGEALELYRSLPESLKKERCFLIQYVSAAAETGAKEGAEAMDAFKKVFPGDPALSILSIDLYVAQKKFDLAIAGIDDLDKAVGGDPYLHVMKGSYHVMAGSFDKAKAAARKAIELDKSLASAYWLQVTISLREKKFPDTVKTLTSIEKTLGLEVGDLTKNALYADFVKSPEYAAWMKSRKK